MRIVKAAIAAALLTSMGTALAIPANAPNPFNERLRALNELQRNSVLRRGILDSGQQCKRVVGSVFNGAYGNLMRWTAWCEPVGDYAVYIGTDQSVQVRPCTDVAQLKLPLCAARPKTGKK
ncbi:hypothetical protein [Flavisphingomonas formosensis]|uniref:hypothetical protein n=1 Tax=Flavisphingomonas formosensis TaxID=861534 RepID=UPI0012F8C9E9|nr:hypothetical protein [Sphingomonas formosensis]